MKRTCIAGVFVVLALWLGIGAGYRDGIRDERLLWEATAQSERSGIVTLQNEPARVESGGPVYRNPHAKVRMVSLGKPMVNVPDSRTYLQFEHSRP